MGYIEVNDELNVYSVSDDLVKLFDWGVFMLKSLTPGYYVLLTIGLIVLLIISVALKVGAIGKEYISNGK